MGSHKKKGCYSPEYVAAPLVPDYNVTGDVTPDCTCNYYYAGTYNNHPFYKRHDSVWYIWNAADGNTWFISAGPGIVHFPHWLRSSPDIVGSYVPIGVSGVATVSPGGH
jgi:hypothetical protein